jgi:peptidoglycan/LPS O-acetylase OafA/YrhL
MNLQQKYFPQIDALRFYAVFLVCASHWVGAQWVQYIHPGKMGVDIFFVISGFLITRNLLILKQKSSQGTLKNYFTFFLRRVFRIFPAYYAVLIVVTLLGITFTRETFWWNLAYLSNIYIINVDMWPGAISHFWSLAVEEHFYLIWPILLLSFSKNRSLIPVILIFILGFGTRLYLYLEHYSYMFTYIFSLSCFDAFAIGGLMAYLYVYHYQFLYEKLLKNKILAGAVIALAVFNIIKMHDLYAFNFIWYRVMFRLSISLLAFFIIGWATKSNWRALNDSKIIYLGKISYSMYIIHNFLPAVLGSRPMPFGNSELIRFIVYMIITIVLSAILYRVVELPFNKIKSKFKYQID